MAVRVATIITRTATVRLISVSLVQAVGPKMITCRSTLMRSRTPFANTPSRTPACHVRPLIREGGGPRVTFDTLVHDFSPIAYRSRDSLSCFTQRRCFAVGFAMKVFVRADRVSIPHISVITRKIATSLGRLFQNSPISLALRAHRLIPIPVRIAEFGKLNGLFLSKTPDRLKLLIALAIQFVPTQYSRAILLAGIPTCELCLISLLI